MKLHKVLSALILLPFSLLAQPLISNESTEKIHTEDFTDQSKDWPILSEPGLKGATLKSYYYMESKGSEKSKAIVPNYPETSCNFMIKAALQLVEASSETQTIGILFMAQMRDGSGGYVFEFNRKKQYRVRSISAAGQYITTGESGWVKSKNLLSNQFNIITIKGFKGKFDIYINDVYHFSFENNRFIKGDMGILMGPGATGKIDYFYIYKLSMSSPLEDAKAEMAAKMDSLRAENDSLKIKLHAKANPNAAIQILERQIERLRAENAALKKKSGAAREIQILQTKNDSLQAKNTRLQKAVDELNDDDNETDGTPIESTKSKLPGIKIGALKKEEE